MRENVVARFDTKHSKTRNFFRLENNDCADVKLYQQSRDWLNGCKRLQKMGQNGRSFGRLATNRQMGVSTHLAVK